MIQHKTFLIVIISLFLLTFSATTCLAHKVRIFAWLEAGIIKTESKFSGGKAARNMTVIVVGTESGKELIQGTTDVNGHFNFDLPPDLQEGLEITVQGAGGHKGSWIFEAPELNDLATTDHTHPTTSHLTQHSAPQHSESKSYVSRGELAEIIEASLEKKLAPIRKSLAENSQKTTTLQDILGGIGYLLGLAGIATYFKYRKKITAINGK